MAAPSTPSPSLAGGPLARALELLLLLHHLQSLWNDPAHPPELCPCLGDPGVRQNALPGHPEGGDGQSSASSAAADWGVIVISGATANLPLVRFPDLEQRRIRANVRPCQ